ncbi:tetratricopeptide repeat protein [Desulfovibrio sp. OttesenSCG-928-F07]|nr:tetratricopeptide repeat protein [Desulfovibrio sp. OttesenSCG-928-F07]
MTALKNLQVAKPEIGEVILESSGYCLWISWSGKVNPVIEQTLSDYGGIKTRSEETQALWFFFTLDVFLAAAKLEVWAKFNQLAANIQIFEANILCGNGGKYDLKFSDALWNQNVELPAKFEVYILGDIMPQDKALAGITPRSVSTRAGFAAGEWFQPQLDQRLPFKSTLGWYAVLKPVGNPSDRAFQSGWRDFYVKIEDVLHRNKLRFTLYENYLMMPLESLRQFKQWCRDYLNLIAKYKNPETEGKHWPCVLAIADRKGLHFNNDLPVEMGLDWAQLMPDFPHLFLRDAVLLGDEFTVHDVRFAKGERTPTTWCNISLAGEDENDLETLPNLSPASLVYGEHTYCFYCGQRSHASRDCPSRRITDHAPDIWTNMASFDIASMKESVAEIERNLKANPESLHDMLGGSDAVSTVLKAIFSVTGNIQQRSIPIFWRLRGKTYPKTLDDLTAQDDSPVWNMLATYHDRDLLVVDKELQNLEVRYPRDYRIVSLHGFVAMERGDYAKADECWRKAHLLSHPGLMQAWHLFLVARLAEYQGKYADAILKYEKVTEATPGWREVEYRKLVCYIKSGFTDKAIPMIGPLVTMEPKFFNWMLLDPELERGYTAILRTLTLYWADSAVQVQQEKQGLANLSNELHNWFMPDNDFLVEMTKRIDHYRQLADINNFVPYQLVILGRQRLERDFQAKIMNEIKTYKDVFSRYLARLITIRDEAAWFPFPKLLADFNRNYNKSATNLTWVTHNNMHVSEVFKKAQELIVEEEERIVHLEKRLHLLRIVRDGTLFSLIVAKKFLWMELAGLALVLVVFPLVVYYGDKAGLSWVYDVFTEQQWTIQKGALIVISLASLTIASFWTVLRFESIREKLFSKAKQKAASREAEKQKRFAEHQQALLRKRQLDKQRRQRESVRKGE